MCGVCVCVGGHTAAVPSGMGAGSRRTERWGGKEGMGRGRAAPMLSAEGGPGALPARHFLTGLSPLRPHAVGMA